MWTLLISRASDPPGSFYDRRQLDSGQIIVGRSERKCDLILPDEEGFVSREHCTISVVGLELFVVDTSTNGVALNAPGARIAPSLPVPIRPNDRLIIGGFAITVATEAMGAGMSLMPPPPAALPQGSAGFGQNDQWFDTPVDPIWDTGPIGNDMHEFLGDSINDFLKPHTSDFDTPHSPSDFGFGDPIGQAFSRPIMADPLPVPENFGIPEDWASGGADPFPPLAPPPPAVAFPPQGGIAAKAPDPFGADPFAAAPFGKAAFGDDPFGGDPFGGDPFGKDPFAPPPMADDPFATKPLPSDPFATDPFAPLPAAHAPHEPAQPDIASFDLGPIPSDPFGSPPLADPFAITPPVDPFDLSAPIAPLPTDGFPSMPPAPEPAAPNVQPPASTGAGEAGWAAFFEGAGLAADEFHMSPDAMRRMGVLYRQVVLGLWDIIQDRAAFKDEFRVERTQLSIGRNNPLKHLPPLDAAKLLLGEPLPGFMSAEEAVRTAFEDIKKHQLAMLAGVQQALKAVFERLSPAEIEKLMEKATAQRKGLPFKRGIDRWSVYLTIFDALKRDATSNANGVMSVAFREGYETFLKSAG